MKHLSEFTAADLAELARSDVARALAEDVGSGDLTASLVDPARTARARIVARESAVICGVPWVEAAVMACDPAARLTWHVAEGQALARVGNSTHFLGEHASVDIPQGAWHQLSNPSSSVLRIIEIQYGERCEEEDIERILDADAAVHA